MVEYQNWIISAVILFFIIGGINIFFNPKWTFKKKNKDTVDKELSLYRREQELKIDKEVESWKQRNWKDLEDVRTTTKEEQLRLKIEIAELTSKRDFLKEESENIKKERAEIITSKDKEIERLNGLVNKLIDNQS